MIQSVVSRLAIFGGLGLVVFAAPALYVSGAFGEGSKSLTQTVNPTQPQLEVALGDETRVEEPVVQLASLTIGSEKPVLTLGHQTDASDEQVRSQMDLASEMAKEKRFTDALSALDTIHHTRRNDYSVRFLEARILSWSGDHVEAERAFDDLRAKYPEDLDVLVSLGYLQFYQSKFLAAERLFAEVLDQNPDYVDAQTGLERARLARKTR